MDDPFIGISFRVADPPSSLHHHLKEKQHNAMILIDLNNPLAAAGDLCIP